MSCPGLRPQRLSSFIHGANHLFAETEIPHIFSLSRPTMEEVVHESEVIVVGNNDDEYVRIPDLVNR